MKISHVLLGCSAILLMTGCNSMQSVKPIYISPAQYQALSCPHLQSEYTRIQQHIEQGVEADRRNHMGVGLGLGAGWGSRGGWGLIPNISVNLGQTSSTKRTELARILGQQEAVVQAAKFKGCVMLTRQSKA